MKINELNGNGNITDKIKLYCEKNGIFNVDIIDEEWKVFFETLYEALELKGLLGYYHKILWTIITDAFMKSTIELDNCYPLYIIENNKIIVTHYKTNQTITISRIIDSLDILRKYRFRKSEIAIIGKQIKNQILPGEITEIKEFVKTK